MALERWQQLKEVFQAALAVEPEARPALLDGACSGDADLRREVESLLASHQEAGDFLSRPAEVRATGGSQAVTLRPEPRRVGAYRVIDTVGQGGMGTVYRAVRDDDAFQKTVALKLMRGELATPELERRFRQERQILARFQHPNIAAVLDGGTTEDGQPYLVMEYVVGRPLTEYCAERRLGTRERLVLFRTVCDAVQYAHQNLVIHRDLKPGNILVTAEGVPKLLDFGIAKQLAAGLDPEEAPTATLLPMMTPEYASPEQVRGQAVTTGSDVYSLGVLLYEILSGQRPYAVRSGALADLVRMVCETEPPLPSAAAGHRTATRGALRTRRRPGSELRGDLDTIVMKALRKDAARRYATVQELSSDIGRHLDGLPVLARPYTLRYRARKFAARHTAGLVATFLVFASLVGAVVATTRQARIAQRQFRETRHLANALVYETDGLLMNVPGATQARALVVKRGLEYLDRLAAQGPQDPGLMLELSTAYVKLGDTLGHPDFSNLGDMTGALESFRKALILRQRLAAEQPDDPKAAQMVGAVHGRIGKILRVMGDLGGAVEHHRQALRIAQDAARELGDIASRRRIVVAQFYLCADYVTMGRAAEALQAARDGRGVAGQILAESPTDDARNVWAAPLECEGDALALQGDAEAALARYREALAIATEMAAKAPGQDAGQPLLDVANQQIKSAGQLLALGRLAEAGTLYDKATRSSEALAARDPNDVEGRRALAQARLGSAELQMRTAPGKAVPVYGQAVEVLRPAAEKDAANLELRARLGDALLRKSRAERAAGLQAPYATMEEADAVLRTLQQPGAQMRDVSVLLARVRYEQARAPGESPERACAALREAAAAWDRAARGATLPAAEAAEQRVVAAAMGACRP